MMLVVDKYVSLNKKLTSTNPNVVDALQALAPTHTRF